MTNLHACRLANEYRALARYYTTNSARLTAILRELREGGWKRLAELLEAE